MSWIEDQRDKKNTPQPINVSPFQTKVKKDLAISETEDATIATITMPIMVKKEKSGEQYCQTQGRIANQAASKKGIPDSKANKDNAQNSSDEEMLVAALELEKSRRLKKAQELKRKEAEERDKRKKAEGDIIFESEDDEELLEAALALEHGQGVHQHPEHQDQAQAREEHDQHGEGVRFGVSHHLPLSGARGSTDGNQEMMVPTEHSADGQVTGGAAQAQHEDQQGDAAQDQEVDKAQQEENQQLLTPPLPPTTPPRTSTPPGGHTPVRVLCTPLWKKKRDKRMSSSSSRSKPRRSSQEVQPRTRRTGQQTPSAPSSRPEDPPAPGSARPGSQSPQTLNATCIIATKPTSPEEKAVTKVSPTGDKPIKAEMKQLD